MFGDEFMPINFNKAKKIWITWEDQRRSKELSKVFNCELLLYDNNFKSSFERYIKSIVKTLLFIKQKNPDVIFVQNPSMVLAALVSFYRMFKKNMFLIVDRHTTFRLNKKKEFTLDWIVFFLFNKFTIKTADITIVTNKYLAEIIKKNKGVPFILPDMLPNIPKVEKIILNQDDFNLLMISSFGEDEPLEEVLMAMKKLADEKIKLYITGNYQKVDETIIQKKPKNVIFTGYLTEEDFFKYLISVNGVIVLTTADHCMLCGCYEAVATGKPLITSKKKVLEEYFTGAIFVGSNNYNIKEGILKVINNYPSQLQKIENLKLSLNREWNLDYHKLIKTIESV
jgi:hypothetical protein